MSRDTSTDEELPLAYRFTSSTLSPHAGSDPTRVMSEVERKKKMKSMKQKVKRSASASRVEDMKSTSPTLSPSTQRKLRPKTPPARPSFSRGSSEESVDLKRKQLIAEKVAELKRIRDLAKAYADGEQPGPDSCESSSPPCKAAMPNNNSAPKQPHDDCYVAKPVPTVAVLPSHSSLGGELTRPQSQFTTKSVSPNPQRKQRSSQKAPDRFAVPNFEQDERTSRQQHYDGLRQMNVSRYDNDSFDEPEILPKFPVPKSMRSSTGSTYSNVPNEKKGYPADPSKVNDDVQQVVCAINSRYNFWNRNVDAVEVQCSMGSGVSTANATNNFTRECSISKRASLPSVDNYRYSLSDEERASVDNNDIIESDEEWPEELVCYSHVLSLHEHASLHEVVPHCSYDMHDVCAASCRESLATQTCYGENFIDSAQQLVEGDLARLSCYMDDPDHTQEVPIQYKSPEPGNNVNNESSDPNRCVNKPLIPNSLFGDQVALQAHVNTTPCDNFDDSTAQETMGKSEFVKPPMTIPPLFCFTPHPMDHMYVHSDGDITPHSHSSHSLSGLSSAHGERYCSSLSSHSSPCDSPQSLTFTETSDELTNMSDRLHTNQSITVSRVTPHFIHSSLHTIILPTFHLFFVPECRVLVLFFLPPDINSCLLSHFSSLVLASPKLSLSVHTVE